MNRRNFALSTLAVAAMALVPFTACKKDGGGGASGSSSDMISYMPMDSSLIVGISVEKARSSALFKKYQEMIMSKAGEGLESVKEKCGIDVLTVVNTVVLALAKDPNNPDASVFGIKGNFDKKKVEECVTKLGGKVEGSTFVGPNGKTLHVFWASSDTILISKELTADKIKASKDGASVKQNKDLMGLIGKVDSKATLWIAAGTLPPDISGMMGGMGNTPPKSGFVSLNIDGGVDLKVGLIFNSDDEAKAMATMIDLGINMGKGQPGMKDALEAVSSTQDGKTIVITAKISSEQISGLEGMAKNAF